jgi:hypothetical protein
MFTLVRLSIIFLILGIQLLPGQPASATQSYNNAWGKVTFETPLPLSPPMDIGIDAVTLSSPTMEIILVAVTKEMQEAFGNNDGDILEYIKTTFFAVSGPPTATVDRTFLGKKYTGEKHAATIPQPKILEIHLLTLKSGDKLALVMSHGNSLSDDDAEKVAAMIAATLKEGPSS